MPIPTARVVRPFLVAWTVCVFATLASSQVSHVELERGEPFAGGQSFGDVGPYERILATVHFALDPDDPRNARVVDLALAPRDEDGLVRARANLEVLQPSDPEKRGIALLEVSNRGGKASLRYFNRAGRGSEEGDGLLMRLGVTVIWVGWQFDVPERGDPLRLQVPKLADLTGRVRSDWVVDEPATRLELAHRNHVPYAIDDPDSDVHMLTRRAGRDAPREEVPRSAWRFSADGVAIEAGDAFEPGYIYELVWQAREPSLVGLGLTAIRDIASFAKRDPSCFFAVDHVVAIGISQTGRFLRHYLYQGFNTDTSGRAALDGVMALTAGAGRGSFNHRFAQPSRDAHRYSAFVYPTDIFPFTSRLQEDPETGRIDGLFAHQHDPAHLPKTFYINSGYEYWGRAAALIHTSVDGRSDFPPTARERIYHLAGAQHFTLPMPQRIGAGGALPNCIDMSLSYRALLVAMLEWVRDGTAPPASHMPLLADGSLVPLAELARPQLAGVEWPQVAHTAYRADYGPEWGSGVVSHQPPRLGSTFPVLVPQVDARGNELGGLLPIELRVPLATYLPWSLRADGELRDFRGAAVLFPPEQRAELYPDRVAYEEQLRAAGGAMIEEGVLLAEDLERAVTAGLRLWDLRP